MVLLVVATGGDSRLNHERIDDAMQRRLGECHEGLAKGSGAGSEGRRERKERGR